MLLLLVLAIAKSRIVCVNKNISNEKMRVLKLNTKKIMLMNLIKGSKIEKSKRRIYLR